MILEIFFRTNLIFLRKINGLTYQAIGNAVKKEGKMVSEWCHGTSEPTLLEAAMLAHFFRIRLDDLFLNDLRNNTLLYTKKGRNLYAKNAFQNVSEGLEELLQKYHRLITQKNKIVVELMAANATQESLIITQNFYYRRSKPRVTTNRRRIPLPNRINLPIDVGIAGSVKG